MGSKQRQAQYDRLNKRYGEKYNINGKQVARIRSSVLTNNKTREDMVKLYQEKIATGTKQLELLNKNIIEYKEALTFLLTCTVEQFADLTERNPKDRPQTKKEEEQQ